jgi:hypothetical protein
VGKKTGKRSSKLRAVNAVRKGKKGPLNPYLVLAVAIVLPGVGQVLNNAPARGLFMVFFMLVGAWICFNTTTPAQSFLGRYAGGWFVYAISILDAYKWARVRYEIFKFRGPDASEDVK